jgi:hypothetical protein
MIPVDSGVGVGRGAKSTPGALEKVVVRSLQIVGISQGFISEKSFAMTSP